MTILYRTSGDWGAGEGANLTPGQIDLNFWDLAVRMLAVETTPVQPNEITNITAVGTQMTVHMADTSTFGPITLPRALWSYRGNYVTTETYAGNDIITAGGSIYQVLESFTNLGAFDAGAVDGSNNPLFRLMLTSQTQAVVDATALIDSAGTFTLGDSSVGVFYVFTEGVDILVPDDSAWGSPPPIGTEISFLQDGTGPVHIEDSSAVTIKPPVGFDTATEREGAVIMLKKISANRWNLFGMLADIGSASA